MKINILSLVKGVSELAVSAGAGAVVGNLVKATTPDDLNRVQKLIVGIGAYGVGAVIGDLTAKYISDQIDGYADRINQIFHPIENVKTEVKEADNLENTALDNVTVDEIKKPKRAPKSTDSE